MKIGSLCSGYGGLDLAVQSIFGGELAWWSDIEPGPIAVMSRHTEAPNLGDLKEIDWSTVERVDILTAGYPCQPFSNAGRRLGTEDPRHIWPWIAYAIGRLRPRIVVLENVAGHLRRGFNVVLSDLTALGYDVRWTIARASDAGAPHRRERLFIVAYAVGELGNWGWSPRDGRAEPSDGGDVAPDAYGSGFPFGTVEPDGQEFPAVERGSGDALAYPVGLGRTEVESHDPGLPSGGDCALADSEHGLQSERPRTSGRQVRERPPERGGLGPGGEEVDWGEYTPAINRWTVILGRLAPCPTTFGRKNAIVLSALFVEWMMGLPEGWVTDVPGLTRNQQLRLLGNGVVPQQAEYAIRLLLESG